MVDGMKQVDSLRSLLFRVFMHQVIRHCKRGSKEDKDGKWNLKSIYLQTPVYADNIFLIITDIQDLQHRVVEWASVLKENSMNINITKSKVMKIGEDDKIKIQCK